MLVEAYHLPDLEVEAVEGWTTRESRDGAVTLRFPVLGAGAVTRICDRLVASRAAYLAELPVRAIVDRIDAAAARLGDATDPLRRLADTALPVVTGYSVPMIEHVLERSISDWRAPALVALLHAELPHAEALDRFVARPGSPALTRGSGPRLAYHAFSGNVPGVAVTSIVRSLLVKAATLGKTAAGEPLLPVLFARALAEIDARLGACLAVGYWPGGDAIEDEALRAADTVIAYGGRRAIDSLRSRVPAETRLVEHGPRISFGLIGRDVLADEESAAATARAVARATATFDQQGCVSPHFAYVEIGAPVSPADLARRIAAELERLEHTLPRAALEPAEAAAIHDARTTAEFRGIAGEAVEVFAARKGTGYTVIVEPRLEFQPSCLNRVLYIKPIENLDAIPDLVAPHRELLQTVAIAGAADRLEPLAARLAQAGAARITSFEAMPWPPPEWHHDGRGPLNELLRWVDLEL